jgi:hypothetical protein
LLTTCNSFITKLYCLVSRYALDHRNHYEVSVPISDVPLSLIEEKELQELRRRIPSLTIPAVGQPVPRYQCCTYYNIKYVGVSKKAGARVRDCHAAVDFLVGRKEVPLRAYGEIQHFFYLPLRDSGASFCVAYVEWFKTQKDNEFLYRDPLRANEVRFRAVPISEFVCKFALLPLSNLKAKYAKLELL